MIVIDDFGHERYVGLFGETLLYSCFRNVLSKLWTLWELMMTGTPLLVIAPSPTTTSTAIASLMGIISPVAYEPDFRPYFTLHDPDFHQLVIKGQPTQENGLPKLIGVTNLYFLKSLQWDNVLSVGCRNPVSSASIQNNLLNNQQQAYQQGAQQQQSQQSGGEEREPQQSTFNFFKQFRWRMAGPQILMSEHVESLWTTYRALTVPDKKLITSLQKANLDGGASHKQVLVKSEMIRNHFAQLTKDFLAPYKRYYEIKLSQDEISMLPEFSKQEFTTHLWNQELPSGLLKRFGGSASTLIEMYKRFMEGSNFAPWMRGKLERYGVRIPRELLQDLSNIIPTIPPEDEVALLDKFFEVEQQLDKEKKGSLLAADLEAAFSQIFHQLPEDMQYTLLSSPARAAIIKGLS